MLLMHYKSELELHNIQEIKRKVESELQSMSNESENSDSVTNHDRVRTSNERVHSEDPKRSPAGTNAVGNEEHSGVVNINNEGAGNDIQEKSENATTDDHLHIENKGVHFIELFYLEWLRIVRKCNSKVKI